MKLLRLLAASIAALTIIVLVACDGTTNPITVTVPNPVDSLKATSVNAATVRLKWNASSTTNINGYRVTILNTVSGATIGTVNVSGTIVDINGLTAGAVYLFRVQTRTADTVSASKEIRWSPAVRVTTMQSGVIRIYETASGFGSGLAIQGGIARNLIVASGADWDFGIETRSADTLRIGSPGSLNYSSIVRTPATDTRTGDQLYLNVDSLSQVFDTQVQMGSPGSFAIPLKVITKGLVLAIQTRAGNFAKIFVKSANNSLLQGTAPNRYVEVEISYQPVANVPYAIIPNANPIAVKGFIDGVTFTKITP